MSEPEFLSRDVMSEYVDLDQVILREQADLWRFALAENVFAGTAMLRRAGYMYGAALERGPRGQIGTGHRH